MYGKFGIKLLDLNIIHFCVASSILFNQLALLLRETHNTFGAGWLDHTRSTLSTRVLELADCFLLQHDSDKFQNLSIMFPYRFSSFVHHFPVMFLSTSSGRCRVMQRVPGDLKTLQELISSGHVVNAGRGQRLSEEIDNDFGWFWYLLNFYVVFWWIERDWNIWSLAPGIHPISDSYQSWAQPFQATFTDRSQAFAPLGYVNTTYIYIWYI